LEPKLVAVTAGASILTWYGISEILSPAKLCEEAYSISLENQPPVISHIIRNSGVLTSTATCVTWCLAYSLAGTNRAMGAATIPYALRSLQNIITNAPAKFGLSVITEYGSLFVSSWTAYATLCNAPFANTAVKALAAGMILRGLYLIAFPYTMVAGMDKMKPDFLTMNARNYGNNLVINGVYFAAIGMGFDVFKSFGYCWWCAAAGMGMLNLKDIPTHAPTAVTPTTIWVVLCAVLGTIAAM